jgi:hypothetical protein
MFWSIKGANGIIAARHLDHGPATNGKNKVR